MYIKSSLKDCDFYCHVSEKWKIGLRGWKILIESLRRRTIKVLDLIYQEKVATSFPKLKRLVFTEIWSELSVKNDKISSETFSQKAEQELEKLKDTRLKLDNFAQIMRKTSIQELEAETQKYNDTAIEVAKEISKITSTPLAQIQAGLDATASMYL